MKKIFTAILIMMATLTFAQKVNWKEMHDFHAVIGKTFHPAEENNLKPTKDSAAVLLQKAKLWQASVVPNGYNAAITKPILKQLVASCTAVQKAVQQKKSDAELKTLITKTHDIFHEIMEKCSVNEQH
jgi:hypothetical protein